ncbi:hypothetical protein EYF80_018383 [Liparis tanakae]|uniref:Uncharacterized protein n=1 Tax=Liparis tanakae TaxID=230148 RepID=A0A4Z2I2A3_9TELE|nr:hypothetical protein EYF80_018383 [Liparis tanakae]
MLGKEGGEGKKKKNGLRREKGPLSLIPRVWTRVMSHSTNKRRCRLARAFIFHRRSSNHIQPVEIYLQPRRARRGPFTLSFIFISPDVYELECGTSSRANVQRTQTMLDVAISSGKARNLQHSRTVDNHFCKMLDPDLVMSYMFSNAGTLKLTHGDRERQQIGADNEVREQLTLPAEDINAQFTRHHCLGHSAMEYMLAQTRLWLREEFFTFLAHCARLGLDEAKGWQGDRLSEGHYRERGDVNQLTGRQRASGGLIGWMAWDRCNQDSVWRELETLDDTGYPTQWFPL